MVIGLLVFGNFQVFGNRHDQTTAAASVVKAESDSLESLSMGDNQGQHGAEVAPITDREIRYLGPASDSATVALAEAGELHSATELELRLPSSYLMRQARFEVKCPVGRASRLLPRPLTSY